METKAMVITNKMETNTDREQAIFLYNHLQVLFNILCGSTYIDVKKDYRLYQYMLNLQRNVLTFDNFMKRKSGGFDFKNITEC